MEISLPDRTFSVQANSAFPIALGKATGSIPSLQRGLSKCDKKVPAKWHGTLQDSPQFLRTPVSMVMPMERHYVFR